MIPNTDINFPQETHPERMAVVNRLLKVEGKVILDIGCGKNKTIDSAIGIDILPLTDIQGGGDELSFDNDSVDHIISRHSFEHFVDPVKTMREWIRVLRENGKIFMVLPDHSKVNTLDRQISAEDMPHCHVYTPESITNFISLFESLVIVEIAEVIPFWSFLCVVKKTWI